MAHLHLVTDNDFYFSINAETRSITCLAETPPIISQLDHNSEYFTFELPRYIEGHDMLQCDVVEVHYINIASDSSISRNTGIYPIKDLQIDSEDETESTLLCSWLISQNATMLVGSLSFALRFACTTRSKVDYNWSTSPFSGVTIAPTVDNSNIVIEQYPDIIQQWYNDLVMSGTMGVNIVVDAQNKALEAIAKAEEDAIEHLSSVEVIREVEQEVLDNIRSAEAVVMEREREELIAEILERVILNGNNTYTRAEGVSV